MMADATAKAKEITDFLLRNEQEILNDLAQFVLRETPSDDKGLLDEFAEFLAAYGKTAGGKASIVSGGQHGNHVRFTWGPGGYPSIFLLGHFDTVWPRGTLATMPFLVENGIARGPGIFDMKSGLVQGFWAIRALHHALGVDRSIVFFCNSDEEIGSPSSGTHIEEQARSAAAVLVLEPSLDGNLKTARKGIANLRIKVHGSASHAGLEPPSGPTAVDELCRLVLEVRRQHDPSSGVTVNVSPISGGTRPNVVAAEAQADVEIRFADWARGDEVCRYVHDLAAEDSHPRIVISGGVTHPPMPRTRERGELVDIAKELACTIGFELGESAASSASDANRCAAVGALVLDGLGPVGGAAHALAEHINVASIMSRAALLALMIDTLDTPHDKRIANLVSRSPIAPNVEGALSAET